jgi:hypothetical protein
MKKYGSLALLFFLWAGLSFVSSSAEPSDPGAKSRDTLYAVETDDTDASESLNRIAGHIDTGFAPKKNTFRSEEQYGPSPFAHQKSLFKDSE